MNVNWIIKNVINLALGENIYT